jgi:spore photoproduct lyase
MVSKVKSVVRKSMKIRESGRSSDYITPSFGYGCLFNCSYCYMKRHVPEGLTIANNPGDILTKVNNHVYFLADVKKPNQTHSEYITYDISCNEDFALHAKHHNWKYIFEFFKDHPKALGTFATKTVPIKFLEFDPKKKIRIRFSLMPQNIADKLEPNTAKIIDRIKAVDAFIEAGYDVHLNFSPVVVYDNWLEDYDLLFKMCSDYIENKEEVLSEVIFLTHNEKKHQDNLTNNLDGEELLWTPENQENKTSQYGGINIRYKYKLKRQYIKEWTDLHDKIIPWNTIRYIF